MKSSQQFSDRLQSSLERKGLTKADLARTMQLSYSSVDRWFRGSMPHLRTMPHLARVLGVSEEWLFEGKGSGGGNSSSRVHEPASDLPRVRNVHLDSNVLLDELLHSIPLPTIRDIVSSILAEADESKEPVSRDNLMLMKRLLAEATRRGSET